MIRPNLIGFTGNVERTKKAWDELKRVGFKNIDLWWAFPNPFDKVLLKSMPHTKMFDQNIGFFNCSRMHYRIIKTAYELGRERVMICEDDVRFRKDIDFTDEKQVKTILEYDADVILLDGIPPKKGLLTPLKDRGDGFSDFESMRSCACYILSRKAMERILWLYESAINPSVVGRLARICDQWFERKLLKGLRLVVATPNVAVQQTTTGEHNSGNAWRLTGYKTLGIDLNDYQEY